MAANSADRTLPTLPNEILMIIVRSFQWTEDIDELRFLWKNLQEVSPIFEEIVRKVFAARNIPNLPELVSLLPTSRLFLETYGPDDDTQEELWLPPYDIDAPFNRLLTHGTAVFRFRHFVSAETRTAFFEEARYGIHLSMGGCRFDVQYIVSWDRVSEEFLISWTDLYSAYVEGVRRKKVALAELTEEMKGCRLA